MSRKIKYKGNGLQKQVWVDTMETTRQSGAGYVKRLLQLFGFEDEYPWPELKLHFNFYEEHKGEVAMEGGVRPVFFHYFIGKEKGKKTWILKASSDRSMDLIDREILEKKPPKKTLIKEIIETLL